MHVTSFSTGLEFCDNVPPFTNLVVAPLALGIILPLFMGGLEDLANHHFKHYGKGVALNAGIATVIAVAYEVLGSAACASIEAYQSMS